MKIRSLQFKSLATVISAILAITIFVGGISLYEVDHFIQQQSEIFIRNTCDKEAALINDFFGDLEKSVRIMESYVLAFFDSQDSLTNQQIHNSLLTQTDKMFANVAKNTSAAVAYYVRLSPEISTPTSGIFYSQLDGGDEYICIEPTDLSLYARDDTAHVGWFWQPYEAQKPIWLKPYLNENNNILMISYVIPLYYEGQFIGVVGMDFDYTFLTDWVCAITIYEHGYAHLEMDGMLMCHEDHAPDAAESDRTDDYLRVSSALVNGMTLVLSASYNDILQIRYDIMRQILLAALLLVSVFSLIVIFVLRQIIQPLKTLTAAAQKLSNGDYHIEIAHSDTEEINLLSTAFESMIIHLREHERLQQQLAYRDSLTGLRNTTAYNAWVTDFNKEIQSKQPDFGVIVLDNNFLKATNDQYGHDVGNQLILASSQLIAGVFKRSPVFRIGGDEFLVVLQNKDLADYEQLLARLDDECANTCIDAANDKVRISIAKGFARYDAARDTQFADVFNRADEAMYVNKRNMKAAIAP